MSDWQRIEDLHPRWYITNPAGDGRDRLITDFAISVYGRLRVERLLAGLPPLPEQAWSVLSLRQRADYLRQTGSLLCSRGRELTEKDVAAVERFTAWLRTLPRSPGRHHAPARVCVTHDQPEPCNAAPDGHAYSHLPGAVHRITGRTG